MTGKQFRQRILILGGSGFIGNAVYRELFPFFDVHGTYCKQEGTFGQNKVFHHFCLEKHSVFLLLNNLRPTTIISTLDGDYDQQMAAHRQIVEYVLLNPQCQVLYISSSEVFDAKVKYPAYDNDDPLSESALGRFKINMEKLLLENIPSQTAILRLPPVLGINSPAVFHLRQCIRHRATFDVYPNLVITATTINKVCQQIHYIINHNLNGIFHLASMDMVHHDDLFKEISSKIGDIKPIFKNVFTSNEVSYKALLPKTNNLPKEYHITIADVIEESTLNEEIVSIK